MGPAGCWAGGPRPLTKEPRRFPGTSATTPSHSQLENKMNLRNFKSCFGEPRRWELEMALRIQNTGIQNTQEYETHRNTKGFSRLSGNLHLCHFEVF